MRNDTARLVARAVRETSTLTSDDYEEAAVGESRTRAFLGSLGVVLLILLFAVACLLGAHVGALAVLIIILLVRPSGLLGQPPAEKV